MFRWMLVLICLVVPAVSYRVGGTSLWYVHGVGCTLAAAFAVRNFYDDGQLRAVFSYKSGDPALALTGTVALYLAIAGLFRGVIAPDDLLRYCTPRGVWIPRPDARGLAALGEWLRDQACQGFARSAGVRGNVRGVAIVLLAAVEEIAWRGGVQQLLAERLGSVRAWIATSVLFALAHLGTGNGAVALLALVGGLLWGGLYLVRGRLTPAIIAHCTFSFALLYHRPLLALRYDGFAP